MTDDLNKYIDHTLLRPSATEDEIKKLCNEAAEYAFASVCVNPCNIALAKKLLEGSDVKVCTVIGFPLGANTTAVKVAETLDAYALGADEFDMVINIGKLKEGNDEFVKKDISAVVKAAQGKTVKVIIETFYLDDEEKQRACRIACKAGAHFVKTCTGFNAGVATVEDVALMRAASDKNVSVKASAGIRSYESAAALIVAGAERIGTSAGNKIIKEAKEK